MLLDLIIIRYVRFSVQRIYSGFKVFLLQGYIAAIFFMETSDYFSSEILWSSYRPFCTNLTILCHIC